MFVWSKRLVATLLGLFVLMLGVFLLNAAPESTSGLKIHTTRWMALNYLGLIVWVFVWMIDQARMRGKNVWVWLSPCPGHHFHVSCSSCSPAPYT